MVLAVHGSMSLVDEGIGARTKPRRHSALAGRRRERNIKEGGLSKIASLRDRAMPRRRSRLGAWSGSARAIQGYPGGHVQSWRAERRGPARRLLYLK
jgi:hypothetical protein